MKNAFYTFKCDASLSTLRFFKYACTFFLDTILCVAECCFCLFRGLSSDLDKRDSRYRVDSCDSVNEAEIGDLLHQYRDSTQFEGSSLRSDTLRDLSLTELAEKAGEKYRSGFELGRPFFGLAKDNQGKEQGICVLVAGCFE